ncbi:MAG: autotransporter domain-containing protein, partial [Pseudomonadota bacterium]
NATITIERGTLNFRDDSSAADATIQNNRNLRFRNDSSAGASTIINNRNLRFQNSSSAGSSNITNTRSLQFLNASGAGDGDAKITNTSTGDMRFRNTSSAEEASIENAGSLSFRNASRAGMAEITNTSTGNMQFRNTSRAENARIENDGLLIFRNRSTAANAEIANNGELDFLNRGDGGLASITNGANGVTDFSGSNGASNNRQLTVGSIAGGGFYYLGRNQVTVGGNDSDTDVSGVISDCGPTETECRRAPSATQGGLLVKVGAGTMTLSGANTYTRGTTINGGTVSVGENVNLGAADGPLAFDGGTLRTTGAFEMDRATTLNVGGGTFETDGGTTLTQSGVISGIGGMTKEGAGTLALSNANAYTGPTTVNGGLLEVNGSIASAVTVNPGGTLGGTGEVGGVNVTGGGIFAPGNSIGMQTVSGDLTFGLGGVFEVEVDAAGNSDRAVVTGTVDLTGATLRVLAQDGNYAPSTDYLIIQKDSPDAVTGTFADITTNFAFLTPEVNYAAGDGNDVVLTLLRTVVPNAGGGGSSTFLSFCSVAETRNQCNVAEALDQFPTGNPLFLSVLTQTAEGARQAFNALSGEIHATLAGTLVDDSRYAREAVLGRMMQASHQGRALGNGGPQTASYDSQAMMLGGAGAYDGKSLREIPQSSPLAFWTEGYGAWGTFDGDGNAATADRNLGGFISGMDADVWHGWRVGIATGASFSDVSIDQRFSGANTKTYHLGGYVNGDLGGLALRGGGLWAWSEIETSRAVVFPNFYERQKADYDADTGQLFGEIAYPTQIGGIDLEPFAGLAYVSVESSGFKEKGGPEASLRTSGFDQDVGYTTVGLRAATTMMWGNMAVTPRIEAAWLHAFDDVTPGVDLAFASTGIGFNVDGVPLAKDSALLDLGADFAISDRLTAGVSYQGQYADSVSDNAVKGRLTWLFN